MNQTVNHILSKEGILTTFSIAKKVARREILDLQKKLKEAKSKNPKLKKLITKKMLEEADRNRY